MGTGLLSVSWTRTGESEFTRRKFSREFKIEALRVAQAARDLDVAESVLRRWMVN
jgi:transposase-like protein